MSDTVQQIKDKISILDVVQPYVKLTRAGKYWKGLSPFTKEKTPSFFVSPDRGLYHCFSTGKGGDMFTFVEEMEGVDFRGALKILAEKAGVEIVASSPGEKNLKERLYATLEAAEKFFVSELPQHPDVLSYVKGRGVLDESLVGWSVGYAPKEWQALHEHLVSVGFTDFEIERAGLAKKPDREDGDVKAEGVRLYDRFRGRIMFPIRDISLRVVGFSGRIFEDDPVHPQAKYVNSPETDVFDKSRALYGIDRAREGIRALNSAILVEGQFDLLMAHQAGYKNTVATSGTAFTEKHAELLKRYTPNILICYDGDRAGITAAGRAAAVSLRAGMNVKIAKLPPGKDPADLVKENLPVFKEAIKGALHVVDFYLAHIADAKYDSRTFRLEVSRTVLPYIAMIGNKIDQAHFVKRVADVLQVPEDAVMAEVKKVATPQFVVVERQSKVALQPEPFLSRADTVARLLSGLVVVFKEQGDEVLAKQSEEALRGALSEGEFSSLFEGDATRAATFEAEFFLETYPDREALVLVMAELGETIKKETLHEEYRELISALRAAEISNDPKKAGELLQALNALAPTLK